MIVPKTHRDPPLPESYYKSHQKGFPLSVCRWCGKPIIPYNGRKKWHKECLCEYKFYTNYYTRRRKIEERDGGVCCKCGCQCVKHPQYKETLLPKYRNWLYKSPLDDSEFTGEAYVGYIQDKLFPTWEMDHIIPLVIAPRELYYWGLDNVQTLCQECHKIKTKSDHKLIREHKSKLKPKIIKIRP